MAFTPTTFVPGSPPGISAPELNKFGAGIAAAHVTADGALQRSSGTMTGSLTAANTSGSLAVASGNSKLEVKSAGTAGDAAYMSFHRPGAFAAHFGLDTDNKFKIGGWSYGAGIAYEIWHDGRMRLNNGIVEYNNGGIWLPMGGATMTASNTIQHEFLTEYSMSQNDTNGGTAGPNYKLIGKFIPKGLGEMQITCDLKGGYWYNNDGSNAYNYASLVFAVIDSGVQAYGQQDPYFVDPKLGYGGIAGNERNINGLTPIGTVVNALTRTNVQYDTRSSMSVAPVAQKADVEFSVATNNYASFSKVLHITDRYPVYMFLSSGYINVDRHLPFVKNIRVKYDLS